MNRRITIWVLLGSLLAAAYPTMVVAGEPLDKIRQTVDAILDIPTNEALKAPERAEERRAKLRQAVLQRFGFEEMARRSLGRHWRKVSREQRQEFVSLFSDLLERSYINKIEAYTGDKQQIRYTKEKIDKDGYAIVRSEIVNKRDLNMEIEYRLVKRQADWEVYDVVIEEVSLVSNYRNSFAPILDNQGMDGLLADLRVRNEAFAELPEPIQPPSLDP